MPSSSWWQRSSIIIARSFIFLIENDGSVFDSAEGLGSEVSHRHDITPLSYFTVLLLFAVHFMFLELECLKSVWLDRMLVLTARFSQYSSDAIAALVNFFKASFKSIPMCSFVNGFFVVRMVDI
ncbi:hypothetical protein CEXT_718191 [Caerostris extrusa]|uniref:Uncharacterized protein n=1 Tax=Caerostris extrusa TaxID=172846 RepID=A0AAV4Q4W8_CAEEX|nr:hypothetical protein CEXT_718191 [Caerostris extrusa]